MNTLEIVSQSAEEPKPSELPDLQSHVADIIAPIPMSCATINWLSIVVAPSDEFVAKEERIELADEFTPDHLTRRRGREILHRAAIRHIAMRAHPSLGHFESNTQPDS